MRKLGEEQREVLALFYFADLSVSDIAGTLRIAEGTVKSRLHRARDTMAGLLGTEVAGDA
jgi:RNA polymerase sigma-70 factor, ECF subfamily